MMTSGIVVVNTSWPERRSGLVAADVGLVEDADPVDGGEADQAFGDPGR